MSTDTFTIDIVSDLACPFCYLGKRRLEQALDAVQGPSEVSWHPYQLNPDMPEQGLTLDVSAAHTRPVGTTAAHALAPDVAHARTRRSRPS